MNKFDQEETAPKNACLSRALAQQLGGDWRPSHVRARIGEVIPESGAGLWNEDMWRETEKGVGCGVQVCVCDVCGSANHDCVYVCMYVCMCVFVC